MFVRRQTRRALRFRDLMLHRIAEVLLVSSPYDAFILEQDGRLTETVFQKFSALSLAASPRFTHVPTGDAALKLLESRRFDLVITMTSLLDTSVNAFGQWVKKLHPGMPVVLLALDRRQLYDLRGILDADAIDGAFLWSGDAGIMLTVVKYIEDRQNVDSDIEHANVRVIIVAEDSPTYYSSFLTILYRELMEQAQTLYAEGVNEITRQAHMNSRPKILHATTYEAGVELLERYPSNVMAIISDLSFPRGGEIDPSAGIDFVRRARAYGAQLPVLLQSVGSSGSRDAATLDAVFIDKSSPDLLAKIRAFLKESLGFGDFVFRDGQGREIDRARDLREMAQKLGTVPVESIYYHAARDHFSIWLQARGEFRLAEIILPQKVSDFTGVESTRRYLIEVLRGTYEDTLRGIVSDFSRQYFTDDPFSRLGGGSLGGKARGMAFLNMQLADVEPDDLGGLSVELPKTVVVTTEYFDHFLDANSLRDFAYSCGDDLKIRQRFLATRLPDSLASDLEFIIQHLEGPLAVRSSSLLEDSMHQPLAGIYTTLMLPNNAQDRKTRLRQAASALKLVYASTFSVNAKSYLKSTGNRVEEEKMAVILQSLVGRQHGRRFYPCISGVAQSYNYYPIAPQTAAEGIVHLALGLGRLVVDGGQALRFSPEHPNVLPQFYRTKSLLDNSQRGFYALDMERTRDGDSTDLLSTVRYYGLEAAERDGTMQLVGSVYVPGDRRISDDLSLPGPRIVTFNNILKHRALPLNEIILKLLSIGKEGLAGAVEIEFALDAGDWGRRRQPGHDRAEPVFYVLQIRSFLGRGFAADPVRLRFHRRDHLCSTRSSLGNGVKENLRDIIYVRQWSWDTGRNRAIAKEVGDLNRILDEEGRRYVLIGPGRWGSADGLLGIPVQWSQISGAQVIVEASPSGYDIEPSQGAHFFHNITSLEIGYLTLPPGTGSEGSDDTLDWAWLEAEPAYRTTEHLRWVRLDEPLTVVLDGRNGRGVIAKPGAKPKVGGQRPRLIP